MPFDLRTRLLLPLLAGALVVGAYLLAFGAGAPLAAGTMLALLLALLALLAVDVEYVLLRPLRGVAHAAQDGQPPLAPAEGVRSATAAPLGELEEAVDRLRERLHAAEAELGRERGRREALERSVRDLEERYTLTVERANDGLWEWNVRSGAIEASPRWKAMLRLAGTRVERIDDWRALLHPDDCAGIAMRLESHVAGVTPHFDEQYRLRRGDGEYRWVQSRGIALRHASGKAYRMIVMDNDVHERKVLEGALIQAAEGLGAMSGDDFFRQLMQSLSTILGTRDNLVCQCLGDPPARARTLAYYTRGAFRDNYEYELAGTSCGAVIERGEIVYCPSGVGDMWPAEKPLQRDSYLGVPMFDSSGRIIGHFACMDGAAMRHDLPHLALFKIFAVRAAAELERLLLKERLLAARAEE
jgi:PAS domain S-box-containing protein